MIIVLKNIFSVVALLMVMNLSQSILSEKIDESAVHSPLWLQAANMVVLIFMFFESN